jgi:hypothetical protein
MSSAYSDQRAARRSAMNLEDALGRLKGVRAPSAIGPLSVRTPGYSTSFADGSNAARTETETLETLTRRVELLAQAVLLLSREVREIRAEREGGWGR